MASLALTVFAVSTPSSVRGSVQAGCDQAAVLYVGGYWETRPSFQKLIDVRPNATPSARAARTFRNFFFERTHREMSGGRVNMHKCSPTKKHFKKCRVVRALHASPCRASIFRARTSEQAPSGPCNRGRYHCTPAPMYWSNSARACSRGGSSSPRLRPKSVCC